MFSLNRKKIDATQMSKRSQPMGETEFLMYPASKLEPVKTHPTLVLNMIVKNETRVIERMLASVAPLIDYYVICDTGSTDDTPRTIRRFFEEKYPQINGVVIHHPFRDFGHNRSYALEQCRIYYPQAEYVLLMDADMVLWVPPNFQPEEFKRGLKTSEADVFLLFQGCAGFHTKNARICKNLKGYSYKGVTHEYLDSPPETKYITVEKSDIHILDVGDGGAKADKYERDIRLLQKGLEEDPGNGRYMFYLGNSFKESGQYEKAIDIYRRRIQHGGWFEETWVCYYCIGCCYKAIGNKTEAYKAWIDALEICPDRIENLYEIVNDCRVSGKNNTAYSFFEMAKNVIRHSSNPLDFLFTQADVYHWKLDYEFTVVAYYIPAVMDISKRPRILNTCMNLLELPYLPHDPYRSILMNYKHYVLPLPTCGKWTVSLPILQHDADDFVSSTPSIVRHRGANELDEQYWINVRYVNYRVNDQGGYVNRERIHSRNILFSLGSNNSAKPFELKYDTQWDNVYVGLEDCRLFSHLGKMYYNANRGLSAGKMCVEHGCICPETGKTLSSILLKSPEGREIEKNWVMFSKGEELWMVYDWEKLQLGRVEGCDGHFKILSQQVDVPAFFRDVRGSTNGVYLADQREIWFLCHLVSYEERRYYYHLFIVLDGDTLRLKKWTPLFVFEKNTPVEYSLGFVIDDGGKNWIVSKSSMDRTTEFLIVPIQEISFVQPI